MANVKNYVVTFKAWQVIGIPYEGLEEASGPEIWDKARQKLNAFDWDHEDDYEGEAIELIEEDENGDEVSVVLPFKDVPSIIAVKVKNDQPEATET